MILFGHPNGSPHAFEAALAHYNAGKLYAFCIPWMLTPVQLRILERSPWLQMYAKRLQRRSFEPLRVAPKLQGRIREWGRLLRRIRQGGGSDDSLAWEANDWLMNRMTREVSRQAVSAVHAYEDCSLLQFRKAKTLKKACIYDMPIGYYPAWQETFANLTRKYSDWLPNSRLRLLPPERLSQKIEEMQLADLVLAPSSFVIQTITAFTEKKIALAPYGVDAKFWHREEQHTQSNIRFIYAGQISIRKGIPLLLDAWRKANLSDATLELVGSWQLTESRRTQLPPNVSHVNALSSEELRTRYQAADVFVFPSFFEGFGLVILEAMACGLAVLATEATAAPDIVDSLVGVITKSGDSDELVARLRWFAENRSVVERMKTAARAKAEAYTWESYRDAVCNAVREIP